MQIVGYDRGLRESPEPGLLIARDGVIEREPLSPGRELSYVLGDRRCAGTVDGDEHIACRDSAVPYCPMHDSTWICARCTGTCLKAEMDCYTEHAIYLAAFAPSTFKVGVTGRPDPLVRLREQGADRGAIIRRVEDGRIAREIEADIAASTPIPDSVRVGTKLEGLGRTVNEAAWARLLDGFDVESVHEFEYGLDLDSTPLTETLASGVVLGAKGRIVVLERGSERFAVDMRSLVGHEVHTGTAARELQSSLSSFE